VLFFLPIVIMSIAYALIIGRLWGSKPPGEKMDAALTNQARAKRKVSFPSVSWPDIISLLLGNDRRFIFSCLTPTPPPPIDFFINMGDGEHRKL
jgi:hypothetical protein